MDQRARVRINLGQREVEIEGSEAFVRDYADRLELLLDALEVTPAAPAQRQVAGFPERMVSGEGAEVGLGSFGELVMRLPNSATEVDKMLAAGFWIQKASTDDAFATSEASRRLSEHGVRVGNPSQCVKQSLIAKRVFMVQKGRYRVSQQGRAHLRQLLGTLMDA